MQCLLPAYRAVLHDFHLLRMLALVAGADIVFFTADAALEDDILSCHANIPPASNYAERV